MATTVRTKAELKAALKRKDKEIIIADEKLAKTVVKFKKIKRVTKWGLVGILGAAGVGGTLIALSPATGGISAAIGTAVFSIAPATAAGGGGAGVTVAIVALAFLGVGLLFALWKDYEIRVVIAGNEVHLSRK